jgi:hypothetical protein
MKILSLPQRVSIIRGFLGGLLFCALLLTTAPTSAITALSQGYTATKQLSLGSVVSLQADSIDHIEASNIKNADNMLGVVVSNSNSLLSVDDGTDTQIQVATSGVVQVLVSDINGKVLMGDHITASPINGVGMKANANVRIIGIAQQDAGDGKKQNYKDSKGAAHDISLSEVPISVNVAYFFKEPDKTLIPGAIQSIANALAGKSVSTLPILVSMAIFIITLIVVVSIIYSMIRSSIISVGRNPMSQSAIYRDLIQLSALVLAIISVGVISIYLVLTKL